MWAKSKKLLGPCRYSSLVKNVPSHEHEFRSSFVGRRRSEGNRSLRGSIVWGFRWREKVHILKVHDLEGPDKKYLTSYSH